DWRQPSLGFSERFVLTPRVIFNLIAFDVADTEVITLRVAEIEAAHRSARPHREALGQFHSDRALAAEEREQSAFLGVIRLRRITRRRTNAAIALGDQLRIAQRLARLIAPEFAAHPLMHVLRKRFSNP